MSWSLFLGFLKSIWPSVVGAIKLMAAASVGRKLVSGEAAKRELQRIQDAESRVASNKRLTTAERLHDARKRGLYRVRNQPSDD
ncbi:hypothetical protein RRU01S_04_01670 [Agrobacterium rubi TR3 = NBRC 13261]|uniref:Uncharacterized protein n=1 Tax=Agrobacterium rubi TR3 = NBRC 13261 TaxID=1368415 RepID=A0A081CRP9_9HYPH|nr:hypothetical protein [Agrobacterium rubi]MCL6651039.1 hypothetical protein [Agrobacterium rubi]GAK69345.1 hypothetical protein RRU01S_04_01670 [Agrobacterium rubi TR3 = NBRC 13261]